MVGIKCVSLSMGCGQRRFSERKRTGCYAVLLGVGDTEVSTSELEGFSVTTRGACGSNELKISVNVSGAKTQEIFDKVFAKMVEDAQPIPGFRRVKGGKSLNNFLVNSKFVVHNVNFKSHQSIGEVADFSTLIFDYLKVFFDWHPLFPF
ncbi:hypothetical protein HAX54_045778 [Datura stramonium]|uniref:Trigger factor ribosome-binding bacterial domain-containing protein n=1 Tax=Datura stramonium TaxID=4076 RepID=A0ABS8WG54_DATST|nr:hypothetical protein [Datura stramonium]